VDSIINEAKNLEKNTKSEYFPKRKKNQKTKEKQGKRHKVETRLFSLGEDNFLVEYNVEKSKTKLEVESFIQIENQHIPNCILEYNGSGDDTENKGLLIANQGYKLKLWKESKQDQSTLKCIKTQLGPVYGSPIEEMIELDLRKSVYHQQGKLKSRSKKRKSNLKSSS
jgi:hypothetical protein